MIPIFTRYGHRERFDELKNEEKTNFKVCQTDDNFRSYTLVHNRGLTPSLPIRKIPVRKNTALQ